MKLITSPNNALVKHFIKLTQSSRERRKCGQTVLDGVHVVEAYRACVGAPETLAVSQRGLENAEVRALIARLAPLEPVIVSDALFNAIAPVATPVGVAALINTPKMAAAPADMRSCLLLENIQDPGNLGSIIRSAAAAGEQHLALSKGCAFAWAPRVVRAAMGGHFVLRIYEGQDLPALARAFTGRVIALHPRAAQSIYQTELSGPLALMIGNEGAGLSVDLLEVANERMRIPLPGSMESLNAAAAAAVCLFERVRQQQLVQIAADSAGHRDSPPARG